MKSVPRRLKLWRTGELFNRIKPNPQFRQNAIMPKNSSLLSPVHHKHNGRRFMGRCGDVEGGDSKNDDHKTSARHQFHKDTENVLNEQVLAEFEAAFEYLSIGYYFGRTSIALPGCQGFFTNMYEEELGHANIFSNYVLMRGGHVILPHIKLPENKKWGVTDAFIRALQMEKEIKEKLNNVFDVAEKHKDLQIMDLVSTDFMEEQNRSICEMARLVTRSKITDTKVGEYLFDQMVFKSFVKKEKENLMYNRKLEITDDKDKQGIYK